jgi:hypothetical protein
MTIDANLLMAIAFGVFLALLARDTLHAVLGRFFGTGVMTAGRADKESATVVRGTKVLGRQD